MIKSIEQKNKNILGRFDSKESKANKKYNVTILKNGERKTITMLTDKSLEDARLTASGIFQERFIAISC